MKPQNPELLALGAKLDTRIPIGVESKVIDAKIRFEIPKLDHVENFLLDWAKSRAVWGKGAVWAIRFYDITLPATPPTDPNGKLVDINARFEIYKSANVPDVIRHWFKNKEEYGNGSVISANVVNVNEVNQEGLPKSSPQWLEEGITLPATGSYEEVIPPLEVIKEVFVTADKRL